MSEALGFGMFLTSINALTLATSFNLYSAPLIITSLLSISALLIYNLVSKAS